MLKINMKLPVAVTELLTLPDFVNEHSIRILFFSNEFQLNVHAFDRADWRYATAG